jgi:putative ABC transport system permease protein
MATSKPPRPDDVDREFAFHLEMLVRRYIDDGLSEAEARAKAETRLGETTRARHECRAIIEDMETAPMERTSWWSTVRQDIRYASRVLARTKLFTATALVTLAVGIGATTAIFSVVNAVLLRPLPYPTANRVHVVFNAYRQAGLGMASVSTAEFADMRSHTRAFDALAALRPVDSALTDDCGVVADCEAARVKQYAVSPELFQLLGVAPARGRDFTAADGLAAINGGDRVVILSDALWQQRYGSDPTVIGRTIRLAGIVRTIVGVMPPGLRFPDDPVSYMKEPPDLWSPMPWDQVKDDRGNQYLVVLARTRPGVTTAAATADLAALTDTFKAEFADRYSEPRVHWRIGSKPLREEMVGDVRTALIVLFAAVGCVLLIACANVANLILARGTTRRRELAVRTALGANRRRLVQQLLIETLMLTGAGTIAGIAVAFGALRLLIAINPGGIPRIGTATISLTVLGFAAALALVSGLIVGLVPAIRQAKADPQGALTDGGRGTDTSSPRRRLRGLLVMTEVTLAVVVLAGALLLIRSFIAMSRVPTGVELSHVAVAQVTLPRATYDTADKVVGFHTGLIERFRAMPGVTRAAGVYPLPLADEGWSGSVSVEGIAESQNPHAEKGVATPGYFQLAGIPLIEGRDFASTDTAVTPAVVIVDTDFARKYFPGRSAIGKVVSTADDLVKAPQTIIGVVGHVRNKGARGATEGQVYMAALQKSETNLFYLAQTTQEPKALLASMRVEVRGADARLPLTLLTTGNDLVAKFTARDRFNVLLFSIFGVVALALAAIGLYGVLAFLVTQRTREIGIRMALGGRAGDVVRGVIGEGMALTVAGVALGLGGAYLLARSMKELLFAIEPTDVTTYGIVSAVMVTVSLLAAFGPARRATKVNPVNVLR